MNIHNTHAEVYPIYKKLLLLEQPLAEDQVEFVASTLKKFIANHFGHNKVARQEVLEEYLAQKIFNDYYVNCATNEDLPLESLVEQITTNVLSKDAAELESILAFLNLSAEQIEQYRDDAHRLAILLALTGQSKANNVEMAQLSSEATVSALVTANDLIYPKKNR